MNKYNVNLSEEESAELKAIISKGSHSTKAYKGAFILLNCNEGEPSEKNTNEDICKVLKISMRTVDRVKKRFLEDGLDSVLERKSTSRVYDKKIDGDTEAKLIQLCCSEPPKGFAKWSLRLLADKMIELDYVESISHVAVHKALKKMNLSLGKPGVG
jgi:transposase